MVTTVPDSMEATQETVSTSWVDRVRRAAVPMAPNSSKVRVLTLRKMSRRMSAEKAATTWLLVRTPIRIEHSPSRATSSIWTQQRSM